MERSDSPRRANAAAPRLDAESIASDPEERWPYERREPWARELAAVVGTKLGKTTWPAWKRLVDRHGLAEVVAAADALHPEERWADRTEAALIERAPVVEPHEEDPEMVVARALVAEHGWQRVLVASGLPTALVPDEATLLEALRLNPPLCRKLPQRLQASLAGGSAP